MGIAAALQLLNALTTNILPLVAAIQSARAEGRDNLTAAEWASITSADDLAEAQQQAALARAEAEGR